jgi:hypothetical protein
MAGIVLKYEPLSIASSSDEQFARALLWIVLLMVLKPPMNTRFCLRKPALFAVLDFQIKVDLNKPMVQSACCKEFQHART